MKRPQTRSRFIVTGCVVCLAGLLPLVIRGQAHSAKATSRLAIALSRTESYQTGAGAADRLAQRFDSLPLAFEPTWSKSKTPWLFLARGNGYAVYLAPAQAVLAFHGHTRPTGALRLNLIGGNANSNFEPLDELPGKTNYLLGNSPSGWRVNIPNYQKVAERG